MSIELTNPITVTDLQGNSIIVTNVEVLSFKVEKGGHVNVDYADSASGTPIEDVNFNAPTPAGNIIDQIDTYVTAQGIVVGVKD